MNILFVGDVFGTLGKRVLAERLPNLLREHAVDVCIANGENAAGGHGITRNLARKFRRFGVDVITGGNHSFSNQDAVDALANEQNVLRPLNFPDGNLGVGKVLFGEKQRIGVVNLLGRTFAPEHLDCPFRKGKQAVEQLRKQTPIILVDFHAEATSEKKALFYFLDGMVSAVIGTHTHVQTADEQISPKGTAFITDVGMTGPEDSCIGIKPDPIIKRFLLGTPVRFEPSDQGPLLSAIVLEIDERTGACKSIKRIYERVAWKSGE